MTERLLRHINPLEGADHWENWIVAAAIVLLVLLLAVGAASGIVLASAAV